MSRDERPLVSIFMFCRNGAGSIARAVESVLGQSYPNVELVVQDGASTDGTAEILKSYGDRISLCSVPDAGPPEGMLKAMRRCRGEIVGSCLADEELLPDAVERVVEEFGRMPMVDVLTGDAYRIDAEGLTLGEFIGGEFNLVDYLTAAYTPYFVASFYRRKALADIGLYTDEWHHYGLEFEIWTRLGSEKSIRHLPGKLAKYAVHPAQMSNSRHAVFDHYMARVEIIDRLFSRGEVFWDPVGSSGVPRWMSVALKYNAIYRTGMAFVNHLLSVREPDAARELLALCEAEARERSLAAVDPELRAVTPRQARSLLASDIVDHTRDLAGYLKASSPEGAPVPEVASEVEAGRRVALPPLDERFYGYIANILSERGGIDAAVTLWSRPGPPGEHRMHSMSMALQAALKHPALSNERYRAISAQWAECCLEGPPSVVTLPRQQSGKVRVGYIGANWNSEYMRYQCANFVSRHDRRRFETFCYAGAGVQPYMHEAFDHVKEVGALSDDAFVELLRADGIDIAVEITGFSRGHRFGALAKRCAPVQVQYLNHNGTCGVPNVDYVIADGECVTPEFDRHYSEQIYRLPGCFTSFSYDPADLPPVAPPPAASRGFVTFGCFGSGSKINEPLLGLWARILEGTPGAVLYLRNHQLSRVANRRYVERVMAGFGIGGERLRIEPGGSREEILASYAEVDVSLDTWPYCGGNTIAESLWQGVPVVSLRGATFAAAYGSSLLIGSGLAELVAESADDYVARACALARDGVRLRHYRDHLRGMVVEHGFGDPGSLVRRLEAAYLDMLAQHSAKAGGGRATA